MYIYIYICIYIIIHDYYRLLPQNKVILAERPLFIITSGDRRVVSSKAVVGGGPFRSRECGCDLGQVRKRSGNPDAFYGGFLCRDIMVIYWTLLDMIYIYNINMYLYMYIILYNTMHIKVCPDGYKLHNWYIIGIYGYTRYI